MAKNQRVVITGIGTVLPNAFNVTSFWNHLKNGHSQIDYITRFPTEDFSVKVAAEIKDFDYTKFLPDLNPKLAKNYNHETLLLMSALEMARKDANLKKDTVEPSRVGLIDSSSRSSLAWWEHAWKRYNEMKDESVFDRYAVLTSMSSNPTSLAAINSNIQGFVTTISAACVGGHHAISLCFQAIRKNRADVMYASGHELPIIRPLMQMYSDPLSRVMSLEKDNPANAIRPYDKNRDGFILGEGASVLCLESYEHAKARGAKIYAEVLGTLSYNEADHAMRMDITGKKAASGITKLIQISKRTLEDVDYYCGHGTATYTNDLAEGRSMNLLYEGIPNSKRPPLGSIKPIFGHTFGIAGIINIAATAMMIKEQTLCPTINLKEVDPECEQDHVSEGSRKAKIDFAISLAFAIGSQSSFISLGSVD